MRTITITRPRKFVASAVPIQVMLDKTIDVGVLKNGQQTEFKLDYKPHSLYCFNLLNPSSNSNLVEIQESHNDSQYIINAKMGLNLEMTLSIKEQL